MKNRGRDAIMGLLLNTADGGATKTKLMYSAFLSFYQLKEYLSLLVENGLIQYEERMHAYRTTEKGKRFLHIQNEVTPIIYISENTSKAMVNDQDL